MPNDISPPEWSALDETVRADLLAWLNIRESDVDADDLRRLVALNAEHRFKAWDCPSCGDRVFEADPADWDHFQGVAQIDRISYPGSGPDDERCDHCRCWNK